MKPIVLIGPTSSGKTSLALVLAKQLGDTDILVVDSKQVYKGQDITTGKDLPVNFQFSPPFGGQAFFNSQFSGYQNNDKSIRIFGIDIVSPNEEWSVAQFLAYAKTIIEQAKSKNRQLIIIGGTPQYVLSLFNQPESAHVPPNEVLRKELEQLSVEQLQEKLTHEKLTSMNESDRQNPRRLIRAIEVELSPNNKLRTDTLLKNDEVFWIGLQLSKEKLEKRIRRRVINRLENGALEELKTLQEGYPDWRPEAKAAIGYAECELFDLGRIDRDELVKLWTLHELQYAKRQMQWWKREPQIQWFDAVASDLDTQVRKLLQ